MSSGLSDRSDANTYTNVVVFDESYLRRILKAYAAHAQVGVPQAVVERDQAARVSASIRISAACTIADVRAALRVSSPQNPEPSSTIASSSASRSGSRAAAARASSRKRAWRSALKAAITARAGWPSAGNS